MRVSGQFKTPLFIYLFFLQEDFTHPKSTKSTKTAKSIKSLKTTKSIKNVKSVKT